MFHVCENVFIVRGVACLEERSAVKGVDMDNLGNSVANTCQEERRQ